MVAFSHTLFGLAHHTICTYYTMILRLAPYDFLLRARRKKRTPPPYLYAVSALQRKPPQNPLYRVFGVLRPNSAEVGKIQYFHIISRQIDFSSNIRRNIMIWTKGCHSPVILITEHVAVSTKDSIPLFCKQSAYFEDFTTVIRSRLL